MPSKSRSPSVSPGTPNKQSNSQNRCGDGSGSNDPQTKQSASPPVLGSANSARTAAGGRGPSPVGAQAPKELLDNVEELNKLCKNQKYLDMRKKIGEWVEKNSKLKQESKLEVWNKIEQWMQQGGLVPNASRVGPIGVIKSLLVREQLKVRAEDQDTLVEFLNTVLKCLQCIGDRKWSDAERDAARRKALSSMAIAR